jgi:hypothetical protein
MMSKRSANGWEPSFSLVFLSDERERGLLRKEECYSMKLQLCSFLIAMCAEKQDS